jgi:hypothetical protein
MDPERPRDPRRLRLDPVKAAVITQIFAWDYRPPDAGYPLWCGQASDRRPDPDATRGTTLECRLGAGYPPFAGLHGHRLQRTHPPGACTHPPLRLAPSGAGVQSSAGPA